MLYVQASTQEHTKHSNRSDQYAIGGSVRAGMRKRRERRGLIRANFQGDQILPKLSQLQEVAQKHGDEAQKILKDAVSEISEILQKKGDEASKLAEKAKEDSKK